MLAHSSKCVKSLCCLRLYLGHLGIRGVEGFISCAQREAAGVIIGKQL